MLVQLPICRLEELCAEIPAKLAPVHKLLKFGVRRLQNFFLRFLGLDLQLFCAKVHFQPFLSSSVAEPEKENLLQKEIQIYLEAHCCVKTVCLI